MKNTIILIIGLFILSGCSGAIFEKGLNYDKISEYKYDENSAGTTIINKKNGEYVNIGFGKVACGYYGLVGPLIFPIIPIWEDRDCDKIDVDIWEHHVGIENAYIIYHDKIYEPSKISKTGYYTFPLQIKSITDTAILVVEKRDGEIFKIPFRYKHTFSFSFFPGR